MVTSLRPKSAPTRDYRFPQFHDEVLPSGIRVVTAPVDKLPLATVLVMVEAGSVNEERGKEGIAALTAAGSLEGTAQLDGAELAEKFEQLGNLRVRCDWDSGHQDQTLSDKLKKQRSFWGSDQQSGFRSGRSNASSGTPGGDPQRNRAARPGGREILGVPVFTGVAVLET